MVFQTSAVGVPPNRPLNVTAVTVGTSGVLVFTPPSTQSGLALEPMTFLRIHNSSASNSISITRDAAIGTGVTLNGPGTITLAAGQFELWEAPGPVPTNKIWAIASGATSYLVIEQC